jgi:hypothetical protein
MGILDEIANPGRGVPTYLENLRLMEDIEARRSNKMLSEIQSGQVLQEMAIQREEQEGKAQGRQLIGEALGRPAKERSLGRKPQIEAPADEAIPVNAEGEAPEDQAIPKDVMQELILNPLQQIPIEEIERSTKLSDLGDILLSIPGNEEAAKIFYAASEKQQEQEFKETKKEGEIRDLLYETAGNALYDAMQLEQAGNDEQAQMKYEQTMDRIAQDSRFQSDKMLQRTLRQHREWQPGLARYMWTSTMLGKKSRDQMQKETGGAGGGKMQKLNLFWDGLDTPVKGRFGPTEGTYEYETPQGWVKAPANAQIVSTSLQGSKADLGLTKKNIGELNTQAANDLETINALEQLIPLVEKTPEAVGLVGEVAEAAAGLTGQFGEIGEEISEMIESDDAIEVRTGLRMLTGRLIPRVLGDTSGRYSDKDMERVEEVRGGLKLMRNKRQTVKSLSIVLQAFKNGQIRDQFALSNGRYPTNTEFQRLLGQQPTEKDRPKRKGKYSDLWN